MDSGFSFLLSVSQYALRGCSAKVLLFDTSSGKSWRRFEFILHHSRQTSRCTVTQLLLHISAVIKFSQRLAIVQCYLSIGVHFFLKDWALNFACLLCFAGKYLHQTLHRRLRSLLLSVVAIHLIETNAHLLVLLLSWALWFKRSRRILSLLA